jgi:hypothetical protein
MRMKRLNSIYSENNLMGTSAVMLNDHSDEGGRMDTELFFNAAIANKTTMQSLFIN